MLFYRKLEVAAADDIPLPTAIFPRDDHHAISGGGLHPGAYAWQADPEVAHLPTLLAGIR